MTWCGKCGGLLDEPHLSYLWRVCLCNPVALPELVLPPLPDPPAVRSYINPTKPFKLSENDRDFLRDRGIKVEE